MAQPSATKQQTKAPESNNPPVDSKTPNAAAPRKARSKPIKYDKIVESEYKPTDKPDTMHPLDKPAVTSRGGLKFPGVEFESNFLGIVVKIPAKNTVIKNPTVRQLLKVLDELYK